MTTIINGRPQRTKSITLDYGTVERTQDWKEFFDKYKSKNLTPTQDDVMNYLHELKMRDNEIQNLK